MAPDLAEFPQINGFTVNPRPGMGTSTLPGFLSKWPLDSNGLPSLANAPAPMQSCNAIVNRIDLGQTAGIPTAGELRFVFGATGPCPNGVGGGGEAPALLFNVIFEYKVPNFTGCSQVQQWADKWQNLVGDPNLNSDLEAITDSGGGAQAWALPIWPQYERMKPLLLAVTVHALQTVKHGRSDSFNSPLVRCRKSP